MSDQVVSSGSTVSGILIENGGNLIVQSGGLAISATIEDGGTDSVLGTVSGTVLRAGAFEIVSAAGGAFGTQIGSGAAAYVLSNGLEQNAVIDDGGLIVVSSGGVAVGTEVASGALLLLQGGGIASGGHIGNGGQETVFAGAETVGDLIGASGYLVLSAGGIASDTAIESGGFLIVSSGAVASGAVVSAGGMEVISAGGTALATTLLSGGRIDIDTLAYAGNASATFDATADTLTVTEGGQNVTVDLAGSYDGLYFRLSKDADGSTIITAEGTPCFCRGTLIATERGEVAVEALRIGDLLRTASGGSRPLRWIGRRSYDGRFAAGKTDILPVMVRAGALADGVPSRNLFVSPLHALYLDGALVPAMMLLNSRSVVQAGAIDTVDYFHLELDAHDILVAEGAPAESFVDDESRGMFHNAAEYGALYPDAVQTPARFCAPRLEAGEGLELLRARVAARAVAMADTGVRVTGCTADGTLGGQVDLVDHHTIRGWACDPRSDAPVRLRILDNGRTIGVVDADIHRPDLEAIQIGDGRHGFSFTVPGGLDPAVRHVITVQAVLGGAELHGSPTFLDARPDSASAGASAEPAVLAAIQEVGPRAHGHLDSIGRRFIKGWAWNSQDPNEAVAVQIFAGGRLLVRAVANVHRPDLAAAGIGDGRHGFEIDLPAELSPRERHVLHARIERSGRALMGSPRVLEAANAFDGALEVAVTDAVAGLDGAPERHRVLDFLMSETERLRQQIADQEAGRTSREQAGRRRRTMGPLAAADRPAKRVLVIDERIPALDRDAGSQAVLSHIRAMLGLGYSVSFAATEEFDAPASATLGMLGVKQCGRPVYAGVEDLLRRQANCFDVVYMHRVSVASAFMALARRHQPRARILFSVADLHHLRLARQAKAQHRPELLGLSNRVRLEECTAAWQADVVLTHSPAEADLLRRAVPAASVREVPWAVSPLFPGAALDATPSFSARNGIAFVGHFGHAPNEDAACWLVEEVMPLVWARLPGVPCLLAGSDITLRVHALGCPGVEILGHVGDLRGLWSRVRVAAAPLRFGAGIKGKVLNSFAAGVPCVMTPMAAEGLRLSQSLQALVAEDAAGLAERICRFHVDETAHAAVRVAGLALIDAQHGEAAVRDVLRDAIDGRPAAPANTIVAA